MRSSHETNSRPVSAFAQLHIPAIKNLMLMTYMEGSDMPQTIKRIVLELQDEINRINQVLAILKPLLEEEQEQTSNA